MNKYRVRVYLDGKKKPLHDSVMESPYSKLDLHRSLLAMCSGKAVSIRVEEAWKMSVLLYQKKSIKSIKF